MKKLLSILAALFSIFTSARADVTVSAVFGDNMVLQRDQENQVWGQAESGEKVTVTIAGQTHDTLAGKSKRWQVTLKPIKATANPLTLTIKGNNTLKFENVLVGEVWVCSGQSNMGWSVSQTDDSDLEILTANYPNLRLISIPQLGTQEAQFSFKGKWEAATTETVPTFSAVGYLFGRRLHQTLNVPVGLIDNAWGGSACEAWIPRKLLNETAVAKPYMEQWRMTEANYDAKAVQAQFEGRKAKWFEAAKKAKAAGRPAPRAPRQPRNPLAGQHRPANLFNGVLNPIIGYGIRGAVWYQGESNSGRAHAYREVFPLMIGTWRKYWNQGDFSFYWVQLADFLAEDAEPLDSNWAELREAQTLSLDKLDKVGQAVIIDVGEGRDIHPRNKQIVANRLARLALAKDYGLDLPHLSPRYKSHEAKNGKITVSFDHVGGGLYAFDEREPVGFAVCGEDKKYVWAKARIAGKDKVEVWADSVKNPVHVRYAWANNPVCNLYRRDGAVTLPATPFRTDDFPMLTHGK